MQRRLLFSVLLFFFTLAGHAQMGKVQGLVTDSLTGEPLVSVTIIKSAYEGSVTDIDGKYTLNLKEGEYALTVRYVGYFEKVIYVTVKANEVTVANIQLKAQPPLEVQFGPPGKVIRKDSLGVQQVNALDLVVISAGKFEQKIGEVTVSMEVIKPKLVGDKNVVSLDEVLQQSPGVSIVDDEPQIRSGSGYSFGAGSRVQVLMDDLPMLSGDAGKPSWGFLPLENLSQIEIIKGASSVLYGSSALSGVINMRTAYPTAKPKTNVTVFHGVFSDPEADSAKYWTGRAMRSGVSFFHSERFGNFDVVIGGNVFSDDGHLGPIKDSVTGAFDSQYNPFKVNRYNASNRMRMNANVRYRFKKVNGLSVGVNTNWLKGESMATLIWENNGRGLYGAFDGSATRTKQLLGTLDPYITYFGPNGAKHSLRTRWQTLDNNNDNNQGNFSDVLYGEYQYQQSGERWNIKHFKSTMGVVGIHTTSRGELYSGGNANGVNTAENIALYWQLDKKFFEKLNLSGGVRYEHFKINNEAQARPVFRAGASYELGRATFLRASYGQGYRFPSIAEKFIITSLGAIRVYANPDLQPETSYNTEIGVKQGFKIGGFKGFVDVAAFQQEYNNFIEFTFGQWNPKPSLDNFLGIGFKSVNTGKARIRGAELSIMGEGNIRKVKIQTLMGYTYTEPVSTTPNQIYGTSPVAPGAPFGISKYTNVTYANTSSDATGNILKYRLQHLVRADVGASYLRYSLGVSFRYNSHMQNIDAAFQDLEREFSALFNPGINAWRAANTKGDYVFDLRAGVNVTENHKLSLIVNNALNRTYSIRPLALEENRIVMVQYTWQVN